MSVILVPGDYALIFGAGLFGAGPSQPRRSVGGMTTNNQQLPGSSTFFWNGEEPSAWIDGSLDNVRFVVVGSSQDVP